MKKTLSVCAAALAGGAVLATAGPARAASVDCSNSTTVPNPVYIAGSSASQPILQAVAKVLAGQTPKVSILYSGPSSCLGLQDVSTAQQESFTWKFLDPVSGTAETCQASGGTTYSPEYVDIGVSDVFPASCVQPQVMLGSGFKEFHGAIQAMEFAVPWASSENSISQDAAYVVFGWGGTMYPVMPWTVPTDVWMRNPASGTQVMMSNAIGLTATKWLSGLSADAAAGQSTQTTGIMVQNIQAAGATAPNSTIGIVSAGTLDPLRGAPTTNDAGATQYGMKPLAFQAKDQSCSYYPDSDLNHYDKINIRQGRYAIWGPLHFVTAVDGSGNPLANSMGSSNLIPSTTASVVSVINAVTHSGLMTNDPGLQTIIKAEASANFVPQCAMEVSRSHEVDLTTSGGEASFAPAGACGCYFESLTGGGTTISPYCQQCGSDADCADAGVYTHCNYGYCEATK
jgi:ABC-type phosphate transport system substrate-binding protein